MNRQQRRRRAALERAQLTQQLWEICDGIIHLSRSGPMYVTVVLANSLPDPELDPEISIGIARFTAQVMQSGLTCQPEWTSFQTSPPAAFAVVRTQKFFRDPSQRSVEIISGICRSCCAEHQDNLIDRCIDIYRQLWPNPQSADGIHYPPEGVQ